MSKIKFGIMLEILDLLSNLKVSIYIQNYNLVPCKINIYSLWRCHSSYGWLHKESGIGRFI